MTSKYGTIKITDDELQYLLSTLNVRRHALVKEIKRLREQGRFVGDAEYDNVALALQKAKVLAKKFVTLRENAKLT